MELKEMIKVMQHYENGGVVDFRAKNKEKNKEWLRASSPTWNWVDYDYRIKEQKQKVTIEKWLIKDIDSGDHFIIELSDVDLALKDFPIWRKLKLIDTYEVEL